MRCQGCGAAMESAPLADAAEDDETRKWKCPRCGSWCLTQPDPDTREDDIIMAGWLLEGREWPR